MKIQVGKQNVYTFTFNTTAKTLAINNFIEGTLSNADIGNASYQSALVSVYDPAITAFIPTTGATVAKTIVSGLPVWTYSFPTLPGGVGNGDALIVTLNLDYDLAVYSVLKYSASKV